MTEIVRYSFKGERRYAAVPTNNSNEVYDVTAGMLEAIADDGKLGHSAELGPCFAMTINKTIKAMKLYEDVERAWLSTSGKEEDRPRVGVPGQWRSASSVHSAKSWSW